MTRYITDDAETAELRESLNKMAYDLNNPTPPELEMEDPERFRLYRLCACENCGGYGKMNRDEAIAYVARTGMELKRDLPDGVTVRCPVCRGEGRTLDLVATCGSPEAVGVALVTLGREGEWAECPVGVLDTAGAKNQKWLVSPWLPSARNVSDAGRTLARRKKHVTPS